MQRYKNCEVVIASNIVALIEKDDGEPEYQRCEQATDEAHLVEKNNPFPVGRGLDI